MVGMGHNHHTSGQMLLVVLGCAHIYSHPYTHMEMGEVGNGTSGNFVHSVGLVQNRIGGSYSLVTPYKVTQSG